MTDQPFFAPAMLFLAISVPLVLDAIPRNRFYGVRTLKTLSDDAIWYPANRFGGWMLIISSLIYLAVAFVFPCDDTATEGLRTWGIHLAAFLVPLAASFIAIHRHIRNLPQP